MSPYKNIEDQKESDRKKYERNKEVIKRKNRDYYRKHRERLRKRRLELAPKHRIKHNKRERERYAKLRIEVLLAYGNKCVCCGEKGIYFLELDHINNDGAEHRRELKTGGAGATYKYVKKHNFPKDRFQLLCANCNQGKRRNGGICPHKKKDR